MYILSLKSFNLVHHNQKALNQKGEKPEYLIYIIQLIGPSQVCNHQLAMKLLPLRSAAVANK